MSKQEYPGNTEAALVKLRIFIGNYKGSHGWVPHMVECLDELAAHLRRVVEQAHTIECLSKDRDEALRIQGLAQESEAESWQHYLTEKRRAEAAEHLRASASMLLMAETRRADVAEKRVAELEALKVSCMECGADDQSAACVLQERTRERDGWKKEAEEERLKRDEAEKDFAEAMRERDDARRELNRYFNQLQTVKRWASAWKEKAHRERWARWYESDANDKSEEASHSLYLEACAQRDAARTELENWKAYSNDLEDKCQAAREELETVKGQLGSMQGMKRSLAAELQVARAQVAELAEVLKQVDCSRTDILVPGDWEERRDAALAKVREPYHKPDCASVGVPAVCDCKVREPESDDSDTFCNECGSVEHGHNGECDKVREVKP